LSILEKAWETQFYNGNTNKEYGGCPTLWSKKDCKRFRPSCKFPSWNWAGWQGPVQLYLHQNDVDYSGGLIRDCLTAQNLWYRPNPDPEESSLLLIEDIRTPGAFELLQLSQKPPSKDSQIPPTDLNPLHVLPAGLEAHERTQLLVCQTETAWIGADHLTLDSTAGDTQFERSDKSEYMVIAISPFRFDLFIYYKYFWVLPIETDEGVSLTG
jgi:hypothetical protein